MKKVGGFTLLEVLLVVAVIGAIGLISTPVYQAAYGRANLRAVTIHTAQAARRAQLQAQAVVSDAQWGIALQSGSLTLFRGATFASRVTADDEIYSFPTNITSSGPTEVVYSKMAGMPSTTGTITFTSSSGETKTVTINAKGTITY
jgi:prepilin-type N-terminal cleavage/methylation domain-containing protein